MARAGGIVRRRRAAHVRDADVRGQHGEVGKVAAAHRQVVHEIAIHDAACIRLFGFEQRPNASHLYRFGHQTDLQGQVNAHDLLRGELQFAGNRLIEPLLLDRDLKSASSSFPTARLLRRTFARGLRCSASRPPRQSDRTVCSRAMPNRESALRVPAAPRSDTLRLRLMANRQRVQPVFHRDAYADSTCLFDNLFSYLAH